MDIKNVLIKLNELKNIKEGVFDMDEPVEDKVAKKFKDARGWVVQTNGVVDGSRYAGYVFSARRELREADYTVDDFVRKFNIDEDSFSDNIPRVSVIVVYRPREGAEVGSFSGFFVRTEKYHDRRFIIREEDIRDNYLSKIVEKNRLGDMSINEREIDKLLDYPVGWVMNN